MSITKDEKMVFLCEIKNSKLNLRVLSLSFDKSSKQPLMT